MSARAPKLRAAPLTAALTAGLIAALAVSACGGSGTTSSHAASQTNQNSSANSTSSTVTKTATATATASASASASTTTQASGPSPCQTSNLKLAFVTGQGAAGTAYLTFGLTNTGSGTCSLIGYPGVAYLDSGGNIVQHPAQRGIPTPTQVKLVTLNSGQAAHFTVTSSDVIPSPGCQHSYSGSTVQVFPPNQRQPLTVSHPMMFCNLHVGPVQPAG
jgi:hypothetical protein